MKRAAHSKNPSSIVYWNDLANDEALKTCSRAARGLWTTECLPKAAASAEYGVVLVGARPCIWNNDLPEILANAGGGTPQEVLELLTELVESGAASVDEGGRLFNRRMVRERRTSEVRSQAGKRGAQNRWGTHAEGEGERNGKSIAKGLANGVANGEGDSRAQLIEGKGQNAPSQQGALWQTDSKGIASSLPSHPEDSVTTTESHGEQRATARKRSADKTTGRKSKLPEDWTLTPELRAWTVDTLAATHATERVAIETQLRKFKAHHIGKGTMWAKWDRAWHTWIYNAIEWSEQRHGQKPTGQPQRRTQAANAALLAAGFRKYRDRGTGGDGN